MPTAAPQSSVTRSGLQASLLGGVVVAVLLLLGFAPLCQAAAALAPIAPRAEATTLDRSATEAPRARVRDLPVGLPRGSAPSRPSDVRTQAVTALGTTGSRSLEELLTSTSNLSHDAFAAGHDLPYPGSYPAVERLLDAAPVRAQSRAAAKLGAQLIALAGVRVPVGDDSDSRYPNAAPVGYAMLLRARSASSCDADTNLLLLLTADNQLHDDLIRARCRAKIALSRVDFSCVNALIGPGWLRGQK